MRLMFSLIITLLIALPSLADSHESITVGENDWPWWRGPNGNGVASAKQNPPTEWSATKNILWKALIPGRGHASPIIVGDQVILPTATNKQQRVLCFNRNTGKLDWSTVVFQDGIMKGNRKASQASCTMACDGKRLYVNFLNGKEGSREGAAYTTALTCDGKKLWTKKITDYVIHQGWGASPLLYKHLVIIAADNKKSGAIVALDRVTGDEVWRVKRPEKPNYPSPTIVHANGREQLVFIGCDLVTSLQPLTGKTIWEFEGATTECVSTTVTDGTHIYTSGGYPKNHVAAIRADGSGKIVWRNNERVYVPSMLFHDGYIYAVTDPGSAVCWQSDTGERGWKQKMGGTFSASPILVGLNIYAVTEKGECSVFKAHPTEFKLISKNKLGNEVLATPAICGGRIYMRVAHRTKDGRKEMLYCIGK